MLLIAALLKHSGYSQKFHNLFPQENALIFNVINYGIIAESFREEGDLISRVTTYQKLDSFYMFILILFVYPHNGFMIGWSL